MSNGLVASVSERRVVGVGASGAHEEYVDDSRGIYERLRF
jgi:hypothetical protein